MIRCGVDIIEIERLSQIKPEIKKRFLQRVFTDLELKQAKGRDESLSGIFAAKEAVSKALGTGIGLVGWKEIEIIHSPIGNPGLVLYGNAKNIAEEIGLVEWSVSISHDKDKAIGIAVSLGKL